MEFLKGHGTENDFVLLPDPDAAISLTPSRVAALCDRRSGIGADGVLRVARTGALLATGVIAGLPTGVAEDSWFMDYRNADGSIAEMCGNGVRVFAHHLRSRGLVGADEFTVGTRAGVRGVRVVECTRSTATVTVDMGEPGILGVSTAVIGGHRFAGLGVDMGNPHLACVVPGLDAAGLAALTVEVEPRWDPEFFPAGVNVEVVTPLVDGSVRMRVHERGAGETRSCGTGTVAAAVSALADAGLGEGAIDVIVPGGRVRVVVGSGIDGGAGSTLTGPSVILAEGIVDEAWWSAIG